jgi:hypothetical protein
MRFAAIFISFVLGIPIFAQQSTTATPQSSPEALLLLQKSLAALTGSQSITDITLSGTARHIAGSDDETGTATYQAISGANRLDLTLAGGSRSQIVNSTTDPPAGSWSGPDGVSHPTALHNLMNQCTIFPAFTFASLTSTQHLALELIGQETNDGRLVYHLSASQQFPQMSKKTASLTQHLTRIDIFLESSTLIPVALEFNTHPDNDAGLDIPVELLFSDYRSINNVQIPFHVQEFLNNTLIFDLQFASAQLNSGLSASLFHAE